ncbi:unnamed protein product [Hermetia illucens]|uniref:Peptidase S1 domain-containing protein n=1 Tax=Hermetia illucens TaxID=343691 RepID=A0A7R8V5I4_HERIL|nr:chymotrypsin-1-like [Hermetia illucens]CAD7093251.1 unnamed protein product [Hermetia illucens]
MSVTYELLVSLLICCVSISAQKSKTNSTRIIGGHPVDHPIPYQVSLQVRVRKSAISIPFLTENRDWAHICGGSIISSQHVLTAAHCVDGADTNKMSILVGTNKRSSGGVRYDVESYVMHPTYEPLKTGDVAVMKVKKQFQFTRSINTIELSKDFVGGNVPCKLSGWGFTRSITIGNLPETLHTIDLLTITNEECTEQGYNVSDGEICTYKGILQGACAGDSGGPLVTTDRKKQFGIVSYGTSICSIGYPDAFTRVAYYVPWIEEQMRDGKDPVDAESSGDSTPSNLADSGPLVFAKV